MCISDNVARSRRQTRIAYVIATAFCLLFGTVYELYSHGVYSPYMYLLFLCPLCGGLPFFFSETLSHSRSAMAVALRGRHPHLRQLRHRRHRDLRHGMCAFAAVCRCRRGTVHFGNSGISRKRHTDKVTKMGRNCYRFCNTILMKLRYIPPPASIDLRSPTAYSFSWRSQSAQTSSLLSISSTVSTAASLHFPTMLFQ